MQSNPTNLHSTNHLQNNLQQGTTVRGESKLINAWMSQKAGMKNIDKQAIAKKVEQITRGTNKALHEQQLQRRRNIDISKMKQKLIEYHKDPHSKQTIQEQMKKRVKMIEMRRDLSRVWAHFDFDMFYIACELLDHPEDIDKPCAVGTPDSVLCTANYVARQYGVRSAIPTFIALKLCPELVLYKPDFSKYKKYSKIMRQIMKQYDEDYESLGLDEIYIDITKHVQNFSTQEIAQFVKNIRERVYNQTGLTLSGGVGPNKQMCKMASEQNKPNGQFIIQNNREFIIDYLKTKPIRALPGIGPVNQYYLKGLGIETIQQAMAHIDELSVTLSQNTVQYLIQSCLGIDRNYHNQSKAQKSVSRSQTFKATKIKGDLDDKLRLLSQLISKDLNEQNLLCLGISVSYQTDKYDKKQKSRRLDQYTNEKSKIIKIARELITQLNIKDKVRLLGIRCYQLVDETEFKQNSILTYINKSRKEDEGKTYHVKEGQKNKIEENILEQFERIQIQSANINKTIHIQKDKVETNVPCPICNKIIETKGNNIVLNKHIDRCLQSQGQEEVVQVVEEREEKKRGKKAQVVEKKEKKREKSIEEMKTVKNYFYKK